MTKHVRTSYRRHRRMTWGLATALVLAIAVVAIPIASGAPDKTYTLLFASSDAVTPAAPVPGSTSAQTLCTDATYTSVRLVISNTARNAQLGSADVTFPSIVTLTDASVPPGAAISRSGNVVSLRELSLPAKSGNTTSSVTFSVSLTTQSAAVGATAITARVKQSNDFSDAGANPDANAFDNPAFPRIALQTCNATISGNVYHDRDQSGAFAISSSPTSDIAKQGWTVRLDRQTGPSSYTNVDTDTSDANGLYSVQGPVGSNYRLCVTASSADSGRAWALRQVDGVTLVGDYCADITSLSPDSKGLSVTNLTSAGATGQDFAVVPVTVFDFEGGETAGTGNYIVTAGGNSDKDPQHYVQETWSVDGRPFFVFAPINACTGTDCGDIYLLEVLKGSVLQSSLGDAKQVQLVYDDTEPFQIFRPMPYCLRNPQDGLNLLESGVLPPPVSPEEEEDPHTSCIVQGTQTVRGNGTVAGAFVDFEFHVYSSYDGSRGFS